MKKIAIGGQAVIEGVMMKNADKYAVAVRKPDNNIEVNIESYESFGSKNVLFRIPIIRGVLNFIESMVIGIKTLTYSSSFYDEEEVNDKKDSKDSSKGEGIEMFFTIALSLVIAIGLFMLLPAFITGFLTNLFKNQIIISIIEGIVRLSIFLLYVIAISQMKDIKRVFMYHGAEHKTINCLEAGDSLTVNNIKKHSRYHKRCGTSFLFIIMIVSIIVFMFISNDNTWLRLIYRILLVPVIAGISYEFIRFAGRNDSVFMYVLSIPGMWVQRLTTKEPEDDMIEVAIKSVEGVLNWKEYIQALNGGEIEG